ncbi:hypothetical protein QBC40DRAFT_258849 [Triangularia verruculosa]|uniref:Uncharacterized protein n=1 Tax=Triangularia verruculosa TaxID=2587418 RepID=A0AAN6X7M4_9PEZI|nr:hypothetical protein QBC40DRAFT_258849 [Triangularia verruculosa]
MPHAEAAVGGPAYPVYQALYTAIIKQFITLHVGPRPTKPAATTIPPLGCECKQCGKLSTFFFPDNRKHSTKVKLVKAWEREHLRQSLGKVHTKVPEGSVTPWLEVMTEKGHTVVVTKIGERYEKEMEGWRKRQEAAKRVLDVFQENIVKRLVERLLGGIEGVDGRRAGAKRRSVEGEVGVPGKRRKV